MTTSLIALIGAPNSGKSSLFNALTGSSQKVGNYPGVTVEKKFGTFESPTGEKMTVIDLPGVYSLSPHSPDEEVSIKVLLGETSEAPDMIVAVGDATNLEATLSLVLDLKKAGKLDILVLNMMDIAQKRGLKLDLVTLRHTLGVPVIGAIAKTREGIQSVCEAIAREARLKREKPKVQRPIYSLAKLHAPSIDDLQAKAAEIADLLKIAIKTPSREDQWTLWLDKIFLHRFLGPILLLTILGLMFESIFSLAKWPMESIEALIDFVRASLSGILGKGIFESFLLDGLLAGVGSVLVFLPQILILFTFIFFLEGTGYMMRAAFIMDRLMRSVGLEGRAFIPLLSSFACAIPGILATRTIQSPRNRLITMLIAPLMTCSARIPVYTVLIAAFIPSQPILGPISLQGAVMFGLFFAGVLSAMLVALVSKHIGTAQKGLPLIFELPTYKWPMLSYLRSYLYMRAVVFLKKAGTVILVVSALIWALSSFPRGEGYSIETSYAGRIGHAVEPILAPIGFDWRIATSLIPGIMAREVVVGALGTVFAIESAQGGESDEERTMGDLAAKMSETWSIPTGISLLVWYIFAPQCMATLATIRRETGGLKWPIISATYLVLLAYVASFASFRLLSLFF